MTTTKKTKSTKKLKSEKRSAAEKQWEKATAEKPPEEIAPIGVKPKKLVHSATTEAIVLVCQCNKTKFNVSKRTATAVALKCSECGHDVSVKGTIAIANVDSDEVTAAITESAISPDPSFRAKGKKGGGDDDDDDDGKISEKKCMFRAAFTKEVKRVLDRALGIIRLMNGGSDEYRAQTWQGNALEFMAADFIAGADPEIVAYYDQLQEELEKYVEELKREGVKDSSIARKRRDRDQSLRDKIAVDMGLVDPPTKKTPSKKSRKTTESVTDDDDRISDEGRLQKCIKEALIDAAEGYRIRTGNSLGMLLDVSMNEALSRADKDGGFVVEVRGDERTKDSIGSRPTFIFWFEKEPPEFHSLELPLDYSDEYEIILPSAQLEVIEIVPQKESNWTMPTMCTGREER